MDAASNPHLIFWQGAARKHKGRHGAGPWAHVGPERARCPLLLAHGRARAVHGVRAGGRAVQRGALRRGKKERGKREV